MIRTFLFLVMVSIPFVPAWASSPAAVSEVDGVVYIEMDPLVLPVLGPDGLTQMLHLAITLELEEDASYEDVSPYRPRLADAYLQEMYGTLGNAIGITDSGIIDLAYIKGRLVETTHRVVGEGKVRDVLIQAVHQERL